MAFHPSAPSSPLKAHPACIGVNVRQTQVHINFGPHAADMFDNGWCLGHELCCTRGLPELFESLFKPLNLFLGYLELGVVLNHSSTSTRPTRFPRRFVRKEVEVHGERRLINSGHKDVATIAS